MSEQNINDQKQNSHYCFESKNRGKKAKIQ